VNPLQNGIFPCITPLLSFPPLHSCGPVTGGFPSLLPLIHCKPNGPVFRLFPFKPPRPPYYRFKEELTLPCVDFFRHYLSSAAVRRWKRYVHHLLPPRFPLGLISPNLTDKGKERSPLLSPFPRLLFPLFAPSFPYPLLSQNLVSPKHLQGIVFPRAPGIPPEASPNQNHSGDFPSSCPLPSLPPLLYADLYLSQPNWPPRCPCLPIPPLLAAPSVLTG